MPLIDKGETIKAAMTKEYGEEKGERVFYASRNAGTITGVDGAPEELAAAERAGAEEMRHQERAESMATGPAKRAIGSAIKAGESESRLQHRAAALMSGKRVK
jgi:hypothetical protein